MKYTKANITREQLVFLFGPDCGIYDVATIQQESLARLETYVNSIYPKQQITDLTLSPAL